MLNRYEEIVDEMWSWLSKQYSYCKLDEYVIVPNHFHGIIIIERYNLNNNKRRDSSRAAPTNTEQKIKLLSKLIGAFKTKSSKEIHLAGATTFKWQRSFYDRIIRSEDELFKIRKYIRGNPFSWEIDKETENLNFLE